MTHKEKRLKIMTQNSKFIFFYLYRIFSRFYFYLPILVIYFLDKSINYIWIGILLSSYSIAILISKNFSLFLTNYMTKEKIIIIGESLKIFGILGIIFSQGEVIFLALSQFLIGFGFSFTQGIESLLIKGLLDNERETNSYKEIEAKSQSYIFIGILFSGILGSITYYYNPYLPFILTVVFNIFAIVSLLFIKTSLEPIKSTTSKLKMKDKDKNLQDAMYFYAIIRSLIMTFYIFVFPIKLFLQLKVDIFYFGLILGIFSIFAYFSSQLFSKHKLFINESRLWIVLPILMIFTTLSLAFSNSIYIDILVPITLGIVAGLVRPFIYNYLDIVDKENIAENMKIAEYKFSIFNIIFTLLVTLLYAWNEQNTLLIIVTCLLFLLLYNIFNYKTNYKG